MAQVDYILKKLADRHISDYVRWLMGESVSVIEKLDTELPEGRRGDLVYLLADADDNRFVFHLEFQQDRSKTPMNLRMLGYDIRLREVYKLPVCGVVVYLKESADEGFDGAFIGKCPVTKGEALTFRYKEVKLWELSGMELLKRKLVGIYPLLVLTQLPEPKEEALGQIVDEIKQIPDRLQAQDMLFAFKTLGSIKNLENILDKLIRRSDIMESPFLQEIYQEGKEEGKEEGIQEGIQEGELRSFRSAVLAILSNRFSLSFQAGKPLEEHLDTIEDVPRLRRLVDEAMTVNSPEEFTNQL